MRLDFELIVVYVAGVNNYRPRVGWIGSSLEDVSKLAQVGSLSFSLSPSLDNVMATSEGHQNF